MRLVREYARVEQIGKIIVWNLILIDICMLIGVAAIQHSCLFYRWPPNLSYWLIVSYWNYFFIGILGYIILKSLHFTLTRAVYPKRRPKATSETVENEILDTTYSQKLPANSVPVGLHPSNGARRRVGR